LLTAGQTHAAVSQNRVVALRKLVDELRGRRELGRGADAGEGHVASAEADVVGDRIVEDVDVLRHDRKAPAPRAHVESAQIDAVDHNSALLGIEEPGDQCHQGAFALSRYTTLLRPRAELALCGYFLQHGWLFGFLPERHALECPSV